MEKILSELKDLSISLSRNNEKIDIYDPKENLTADIIEKIKSSKEDILNYLKKSEQVTDYKPIEPALKKDSYPLSPSQKRLYFLYELNKNSLAYNMPQVYRVKGNLDRQRVESTLKKVISRHDSLRTNFELRNQLPVQVIKESITFKIGYFEGTNEKIDEILNEFITPFDLSSDCLVRAGLINISDEENILIFDMHHIIADGVSNGIILNDFRRLYDGETLPLLKLQYKDYIEWQFADEQKDAEYNDEAFWLNTFEDINVLELPLDYKRPQVKNNAGGTLPLKLNLKETEGLKEIGQESGAPLFIAVFTVFNVLLYKLTNQKDIVIGIPTQGRDHADLEQIIGMFVNTLPIRNSIDENLSFVDNLASISKSTFKCFDHQSYPYDKLIETLKLKRSSNRNPLFDVSFTYDSLDSSNTDIIGLEFENYERNQEYSKLDLSLTVTEINKTLNIVFEYDTNLFRKTTIERFITYFKLIVEQVVLDKNIKLSEIDILSEMERNLLLKEFNYGVLDSKIEKTVLDLFEQQVSKTPKAIAVCFEGKECSYKELDEQSNQVADYLLKKGVVKEKLIPIYFERSIEMLVGILGVLKAGGAYVPIDPDLPKKRIDYMLNDIDTDIILTQTSLNNDTFSKFDVVVIDEVLKSYDKDLTSPPRITIRPSDLCYAIYTSGSTGKPKGVLIEHGGLVNLITNQIQLFGLTETDKVLQFASVSFDAFASEMFTSLLSGARLIIASKETINSKEGINQLIKNEYITCVTLPPSYQSFITGNLNHLRIVVSAGETLNTESAKVFIDKGVEVVNAYGPTENSICTTLTSNPIQDWGVSIGKPLKGVRVYILDGNQKLSALGCVGELCMSGVQVARGYLNRDELTEQTFIENPYGEGTHSRLYRSGDLARWTEEGNLEFLGRDDNQVKIRGYRVELNEIERAISEIPLIEESVVVPSENYQSLHAYYRIKERVDLWPSIAEFFLYDEIVYRSMYTHISRNEKYKTALKKVIEGKVVLEIGPGPEAILSKLCIECGAKRVYSVEILEETYLKAKKSIERDNLTDKIELVYGDITEVEIPDDIDYCVSEIVGSIGGSEGAAVLIDHVQKSMKNPKNMIPSRCTTKIAAISLDESQFEYGFSEVPYGYVKKIFADLGENFNFRICLKNLPKENIITNNAIFEDLNFSNDLILEHSHNAKLTFKKKSTFNGFYIWMNLHLDDIVQLDILDDTDSWLPIFFPIAYPGYEVREKDYLDLELSRKLSSNGINPDYFVKGTLNRKGRDPVIIEFNSYHHKNVQSDNIFYKKLFEKGGQRPLPILDSSSIKKSLVDILPDYMIPSSFKIIDNIPLTSNGKVNKRLLSHQTIPAVFNGETNLNTPFESHAWENIINKTPLAPTEKKLADIWAEILQVDESLIDQNSDFFELGGHSLLAIDLTSRLKKIFSKEIALEEIFEASTIKDLSQKINEQSLFPINQKEDISLMKQGSEKENNIFFIHDGSGYITGYVELIKNIDQYNCYGVNYEVPGYGPQNTSIEELASDYIKKIKKIQKSGTYNLVSWSLGGVILYEIVKQLELVNEDEVNVILLDTKFEFDPQGIKFDIDSEKEVIDSILGGTKLEVFDESSIESLWQSFIDLDSFKKMKRDSILEQIPFDYKYWKIDSSDDNNEEIIKAINTFRTLRAVFENYKIEGSINAKGLYFAASDSVIDTDLMTDYFKCLTIEKIIGNHHTIMKFPIVSSVSDVLIEFLKTNR